VNWKEVTPDYKNAWFADDVLPAYMKFSVSRLEVLYIFWLFTTPNALMILSATRRTQLDFRRGPAEKAFRGL
jgi:hypothetical protein